jgi:hypothetical protein
MDFELIGAISDVETITVNLGIRENADLKARYGGRRWRKLKGIGSVHLSSGGVRQRNSTGTSRMASASER